MPAMLTIPKGTLQKADRIFQQAVTAYNNGHVFRAIQTARYALHVDRKAERSIRSNIYGFIAMAKWQLGQHALASYYCHQALISLDKAHPEYGADRRYLQSLLSAIEQAN